MHAQLHLARRACRTGDKSNSKVGESPSRECTARIVILDRDRVAW